MKSSDLFDAMAKIDENITDASEQAHAVPEAPGKKKIFGHAAGLTALAAGIVLFGLITAVVVNMLPGLVNSGSLRPADAEGVPTDDKGRLSITDPYGGEPTSFSGIADDTEFGCPVFRSEAVAARFDVNGDGTPDILFSEQPVHLSVSCSEIGWVDGKTGEKKLFDGLSGLGIRLGIIFAEDDKEKTTPLLYDTSAAVFDATGAQFTINYEGDPAYVYYLPLGKLVIQGGEAWIESYYAQGADEDACIEFAGVKLWRPKFEGRCANAALASGGGVLSAIVTLDVPASNGAMPNDSYFMRVEGEVALELLNALTSDEEVYYSSREVPSDAVFMAADFIYTVKNGEGEKYYFCGRYNLLNSGKRMMTTVRGTPYAGQEGREVSPAFFGKICNVFDKIFPGAQKWN